MARAGGSPVAARGRDVKSEMLVHGSARWLVLVSLLALGACESFGRGVTQAVLQGTGGESEDTRSCEAEGRPFPGIEPYLLAQDKLPPFAGAVGDRPEGRRRDLLTS